MSQNRVTIADLPREAGVDKSAVSRALSGKPGVSEETRERVLDLARELGWRPNSTARSLSRAQSEAIGWVPGVLSTAIYSYLLAWNDYLIALVFLRSDEVFTLPIGLQTFFRQNATDWGPVMASAVVMMLPPVLIFAFLNRYFSVGGIGGSLAGQ